MHQHSDQLNELAAALAKAQATMRPAVKDAANPFFKSRYADLQSVIEAAHAALSEHGLSVSSVTDTDEQGNMMLCTYLLHSSGQWMCGRYPVEPVKRDPQGIGSAISYARRYALMSIVNLATSDDDAEAAMGRNDDRQQQRRPQHDPNQVPQSLRGGPTPRGRGRPPRQSPQPQPQPVETSELYQEVMETIREARGHEDLSTASELAMGLTDPEEQANARSAWAQKRASLNGAAQRSVADRDSIKASLTLPKPA